MNQKRLRELFEYLPNGTFKRKIKAGNGSGRNYIGDIVKGYVGTDGYAVVKIENEATRLHRAIWIWHFGPIPEVIDHINGDRLDNRIENLRLASRAQNTQNQRTRADCSSGTKGLYFRPERGVWCAHVQSGKERFIFVNPDKNTAAKWLVQKRKELHGEFTCHG